METETGDMGKYLCIAQGTFKGRAVFVFDNCCPICTTFVKGYGYEGEPIGELGVEMPDRRAVKNSKIIFERNAFNGEST